MSRERDTRGGMLATRETENRKIGGALEILRRAMNADDSTSQTSENTVQKKEKILLCGNEVTVRRIYVLYGAYRIGWVLDADVNFCMECEAEFSFFKRKHHCRACGSVVCSTCSPYQAVIPAISENGGSRVCVNCFGLKVNVSVMRSFDPEVSPTGSVDNSANGGEVTAEATCIPTASELIRDRARKARKEQAQQQLEEAARKPQYQRAYRTMRCIVPPDVAETSLQDMLNAGLPSPVARRVWKCRCLWLLSMHQDDIKKIHIADLRSKYAPVGLDLVELRAVWHVLPDWCEDSDPEKCEWKSNFRQQMDDLARREENGTAADHLKRNEAYEGYEPLRVYSSNTVIRRRYSYSNGAVIDSSANSAASSGDASRGATAGTVDGMATPIIGATAGSATPGGNRQPLFTPSPADSRRHSFSDAESSAHTHSSASSLPPGLSPPVSLYLYRHAVGDLAATEEQAMGTPPPLQATDSAWPSKLKAFFIGSSSPPCTSAGQKQVGESNSAKGRALNVQTGEELEDASRRPISRPRSLIDVRRGRGSSTIEKSRSFSYSPRMRSHSSATGQAMSMGSETSTYRQRREEERRRRISSGGSGVSTGEESRSPSLSPAGGAKRVVELRLSSRGRSSSDGNVRVMDRPQSSSPYRPAHRRSDTEKLHDNRLNDSPCSPATAGGCIVDSKPLDHHRAATRLFSPIDDDDLQSGGSESESDAPAANECTSAALGGASALSPPLSYATDDNCTPLATRVPFFFSTQDDSAVTRLSFSPPPTSKTPNSTPSAGTSRCISSSGTATALFLSNCGKGNEGFPPTPVVDRSGHPPLTATPLRHMMGTMDSCEVAFRVQQADLSMSPSEATDLLKYALVNFCDVDERGAPQDRERTEDGIILTINNLVERCGADVNAVDRDGNSLLTFILEYSHSGGAAGGREPSTTTGIHTLISCLLYHGINIFMSFEHLGTCHEGFLLLQPQDLDWLTEKFRRHCSITVEGRIDPGKADLSDAQYWNFFAVLVASGRIEAAAFLLELEKVLLSPAQASALLKACKFETMNNAIETYEFLEQHGGQL